MKFKVNSVELRDAISKIIGVVPIRTTIPAIENLLLETNKNTLTISATDLEISMSTKIDIMDETEGRITVGAREFFEIVRNLEASDIEITVDDKLKLTLKTKSGSFKLACTSADEYPTLPNHRRGIGNGVNSSRHSPWCDRENFICRLEGRTQKIDERRLVPVFRKGSKNIFYRRTSSS